MPFASGAVLAGALCLASCEDALASVDHPLAAVSFPIFTDLQAQCDALMLEREECGRPMSQLTGDVEWVETLEEAFARAKAEDKPIFLATLVKENGDAECDA